MNELYHHGILGMKWGVRRTPEQLGHRKSGKSEKQRASEKKKRRDNKNRGALTDAQLKKKIERLKLEQELDRLTKEQVNSGREYIAGILRDSGRKVLVTASAGAMLYGLQYAAQRAGNASAHIDYQALGSAIFNGGAKKK